MNLWKSILLSIPVVFIVACSPTAEPSKTPSDASAKELKGSTKSTPTELSPTVGDKSGTQASQKQPGSNASSALMELFDSLRKSDRTASLSMMTTLKEMPPGYQEERLEQLMKWGGTEVTPDIILSKEMEEVSAVIIKQIRPESSRANYGAVYFRNHAGAWKWADDDLFDSRYPIPSISGTSREEFAKLREWADTTADKLEAADKADRKARRAGGASK